MSGLVERLRALSDQLALQIYATMMPVEEVIREMPTYYARRCPSEVGSFNWTPQSYWLNHEVAVITRDESAFEALDRRWHTLRQP